MFGGLVSPTLGLKLGLGGECWVGRRGVGDEDRNWLDGGRECCLAASVDPA